MSKSTQLRSKTINGFVWSFVELISKQGIQLIIQIILARLLLPEHFGLIGMITIFIAISTTFVQSGMDQALIREKKIDKEAYSTVFYYNLVVSIMVYFIIFFVASWIANFYNEPELIKILRVVMLVVIINAFSVIQRVMLIRKLDFKTQTKVSVIAGIISGAVAIGMALSGAGVWSLVAQQVFMQLMIAILLMSNNRWFPSLQFNVVLFKKYFIFGYKLLLSSLIDTIYQNIYFIIIGKIYPVAQLGYYTNANKLKDVSSQSISQAIQKVTYPVFSNIQDDSKKLAGNYQRLIQMTSYLFFPFMLGLVAIAPNLIPLLLGDKWIPSIIYFQLLCIAGMLYPIHAINLNILKVRNRSDLFLLLEVIKKLILTILIVVAVIYTSSIEGLIYAAIVSSFISLAINTYYSAREIDYSFFNQVKDMLPSLLLAGIMSIVVYLMSNIFNIYSVNLLIQIISGILIYLVGSMLLRLKEFTIMIRMLKSIGKR
ncbi:lipopolysaccharide biosynthesis protein [Bacillus sp. SD088]|uniref:lipopolysaccharide biosynthesis protein n=1 Tax=Bacillus sp. SD088 TaxID=2782012 RepID=UPI001A961756|nr:lipopolysaccharide biosynthesis protein [Bacillus sp. SD088]MBO0991438.1 lipopolysaccharide biosynthesis protein [Bacillus sp. SD088]